MKPLSKHLWVAVATLSVAFTATAATEPPPVLPGSAALPPETLEWSPIFDVFGEYLNRRADGEWFHQFDIPRAHAGMWLKAGDAEGRVVLEATRSAGPGSLVGVGGNSLVLRAREAYGLYRWWRLEGSAGLVPLLTIQAMEKGWGLRAVDSSILERAGYASYSDLGGRLRLLLPGDFGWVGVTLTNGEGYTQRELNRGKNLEAAARIVPLPNRGVWSNFSILGSYVSGSRGTESVRADRATAALTYDGARLGVGVSTSYAWGVADIGTRRGNAQEAFVRGEPVDRLLLAARVTREERARGQDDVVLRALGSVGVRATRLLELFLTGEYTRATDNAQAAIPGIEDFRAHLTARFSLYPGMELSK